ncbi:MAG: hypothetical protein ACI9RO_001717 [Alteromonas macleodii]|jgi:hypothetical protein
MLFDLISPSTTTAQPLMPLFKNYEIIILVDQMQATLPHQSRGTVDQPKKLSSKTPPQQTLDC